MLNPTLLTLSFYETELTVGVYPHFSFGNALFFFLMVEMHLYQDLFLVQTQILPLDSCFFIGWIYYVYQDFNMTHIACHTLCKSQKTKQNKQKKSDTEYKSRMISPESFEIWR